MRQLVRKQSPFQASAAAAAGRLHDTLPDTLHSHAMMVTCSLDKLFGQGITL
jgi:hypothetical protein